MHITLQWFHHTQTKSLSEGVGIWDSNSRFLRHIRTVENYQWNLEHDRNQNSCFGKKSSHVVHSRETLKQKQKKTFHVPLGPGCQISNPCLVTTTSHSTKPRDIWCSNETEVWNEWNVVEAKKPLWRFLALRLGPRCPPTAVKHDMVKQRRSFAVQIGQYLNQRLGRLI